MNSENDFSKLKNQIKFSEDYSEKDWAKDIREFPKLSAFISDEYSKDLAEFMVILANSDSKSRKKKKMLKTKYKVLAQLTISELGEKGYTKFVKEKMKQFKQKKVEK